MSEQAYLLLALANFALCSAIVWFCVMRLSVMSAATRWSFRANAALLLVAATASGFQPVMFDEWPGVPDLVMNAVVLVYVASGLRRWRRAMPDYARRDEYLEPVEPAQWRHIAGGRDD